jgi:hypothetical protein
VDERELSSNTILSESHLEMLFIRAALSLFDKLFAEQRFICLRELIFVFLAEQRGGDVDERELSPNTILSESHLEMLFIRAALSLFDKLLAEQRFICLRELIFVFLAEQRGGIEGD